MVSKVTYKLNLFDYGLDEVPREKRDEVKQRIGDFLKESILSDVSSLKSPVNNRPFTPLSSDYADSKSKVARRVANLELTGAMLDSLSFEKYRNGIEIGIFDESEAQKADNHNKFSKRSEYTPVPKRQFIPNKKKDERFRQLIMDRVRSIIKEYKEKPKEININLTDILTKSEED